MVTRAIWVVEFRKEGFAYFFDIEIDLESQIFAFIDNSPQRKFTKDNNFLYASFMKMAKEITMKHRGP